MDRLTVFGERGNAPASHTQAETRASLWRREGAAAESTQRRPGLFLLLEGRWRQGVDGHATSRPVNAAAPVGL